MLDSSSRNERQTSSHKKHQSSGKDKQAFSTWGHLCNDRCVHRCHAGSHKSYLFNFRLRGAGAWARASNTREVRWSWRVGKGLAGRGMRSAETQVLSEVLWLRSVDSLSGEHEGWRGRWIWRGKRGRSQIWAYPWRILNRGMNVSRSAIKHAASGSRWNEVSQTGGRRRCQKAAVGEHMRLEDFCLTENAS